jgi:hypothetical protein
MSAMVERKESLLAHPGPPAPVATPPELPGGGTGEHGLEISVIFTSLQATVAALKMAATLANGFRAHIRLVVPEVVPYPVPLNYPTVRREFREQKLREIACESPVDTTVLVYLCRDRLATLNAVLKPGSIVVIGGRRRWWPTAEKSLAENMRRLGREVFFAETN